MWSWQSDCLACVWPWVSLAPQKLGQPLGTGDKKNQKYKPGIHRNPDSKHKMPQTKNNPKNPFTPTLIRSHLVFPM